MKTIVLLNRIIEKGGIIGTCAKMYDTDEEKAAQFIKECSKQCHNVSAKQFWGDELVMDIVRYQNEHEIIISC